MYENNLTKYFYPISFYEKVLWLIVSPSAIDLIYPKTFFLNTSNHFLPKTTRHCRLRHSESSQSRYFPAFFMNSHIIRMRGKLFLDSWIRLWKPFDSSSNFNKNNPNERFGTRQNGKSVRLSFCCYCSRLFGTHQHDEVVMGLS